MADENKKRGGARPGAGRKPKPKTPEVADKGAAARIIDALNQSDGSKDSHEIAQFRKIDKAGVKESLDLRKWLYDKRDGKPVQTVNHVHDKPIEMNVNVSLAEAVQRARKRAGISALQDKLPL